MNSLAATLVALGLMLIPVEVSAEQYLCSADRSSGFSYKPSSREWGYAHFETDAKYLIAAGDQLPGGYDTFSGMRIIRPRERLDSERHPISPLVHPRVRRRSTPLHLPHPFATATASLSIVRALAVTRKGQRLALSSGPPY